tara:strand:+ start:920 stop:1201 length:282 start_codon:yes stop_codon:yes gene_type:complete
MKKMLNGVLMDMTAGEIAAKEALIKEWNDGAFDRSMANLRFKRNAKLAETDFHGLSDNSMSAQMTTYRQELRDLTNGITTTEQAEAVVFPTKP